MTDAAAASVSRAALVVLLALAVLSPWPFGSADPRLARMIALVALAVALALVLARRGGRVEWPAPAGSFALLLALGALQLAPLPPAIHALIAPGSHALWHPPEAEAAAVVGVGAHPLSVHPDATRAWLAFALGVSALALLAVPALRGRKGALGAALALAGGGVAVASFGLVARLAFGNRLYGVFAVPTVAPFGPFVSKNHFAGYVEMGALLALGLAFGLADEGRRGSGRLAWIEGAHAGRAVWAAGASAAMALAVLVSLSRGGVVSLAAGFLALVVLRWLVRHHHRAAGARRLALSLVGLGVGAGLLFAILPAETRARVLTLGAIGADRAATYRLAVWGDTLRLAATSPIVGHGLGAYADALPPFKTAAAELRVEHAENDPLELLAEGGALGLGLALMALGLALRLAVRGLRAQEDRLLRGLGLGAAAGAIALLVHGLFDFNLHIPSNAITFAALLALLGGTAGDASRERRAPAALLAVVLALGLGAALVPPPAERSDLQSVRRATTSSAPGPLRRASAEAELVAHLRRRPADAEAWVLLAWLRTGTAGPPAGLLERALRLDPRNAGLRREVERLRQAVLPSVDSSREGKPARSE